MLKQTQTKLRSEVESNMSPAFPLLKSGRLCSENINMNAKKDSLSYYFTLAALVRQFGKGGLKPI